jgi:predicted nucleic acid-binding protein
VSVLVDTSVWIRFLSNRAPYAAELDELLSRDEVSGHDFIYGEFLIGDKGGRKELLANYERMDRAPVIAHSDVVAFVRDRKLHGRGVGWIDVHLLASALVGRLKLWTTDPALASMAKELGISFD